MHLQKRHIVFFIATLFGLLGSTQKAFEHYSLGHRSSSTTPLTSSEVEFNYIVKHVFSIATPVSHSLHKFIEELETPEEETFKKKVPTSKQASTFNTASGTLATFLHLPKITKRSSTYGRFFYVHYERIIRFCTLLI